MNKVARVIKHHHDHDDAAQQVDRIDSTFGLFARDNLVFHPFQTALLRREVLNQNNRFTGEHNLALLIPGDAVEHDDLLILTHISYS